MNFFSEDTEGRIQMSSEDFQVIQLTQQFWFFATYIIILFFLYSSTMGR